MIFAKRLRSHDHTRALVVREADERGWEVRVEEDSQVVKTTWLHDWHRVENTILRFMADAVQLRSAGWTEVPTTPVV